MPLIGHEGHADLIRTWAKGSDVYNSVHSEDVKSIIIVSAHHESKDGKILIMDDEKPQLLFDYGGFPPETYKYKISNPGNRVLANRIASLLSEAKILHEMESGRGHDHGAFVPLLGLEIPQKRPSLPVVSISLPGPADYRNANVTNSCFNFGKALASLRSEGVLLMGSGNTFHSFSPVPHVQTAAFDAHLRSLAQGAGGKDLRNWAEHSAAKACHPRPEHLLPLIVMAGAAAASDPQGLIVPVPHDFMGNAASHFIFN